MVGTRLGSLYTMKAADTFFFFFADGFFMPKIGSDAIS